MEKKEPEERVKQKYILEEIVMTVVFSILLFFGGINIVLRYVFNTQIPYTNDMMVDLFVWLSLFGIPVACYKGANMSMALIYDRVGRKAQKGLIMFSAVLSVALFSYLFYCGMNNLITQYSFRHKTVIPFIPAWFWTSAFPICSLAYIVRTIQATAATLKKNKEGEA